jgi:hypothetical protein
MSRSKPTDSILRGTRPSTARRWCSPSREACALSSPTAISLGKLYRRTDKREQAQERLATATTTYREMGMTYWLEKARREMAEDLLEESAEAGRPDPDGRPALLCRVVSP